MTIVQPTLKRVLMIWLSITFRALALGFAGAIAASIVIGVAVASTGGGEDEIRRLAGVIGPLIGAPVSLYAAYAQLGRKCGDVRLVLISAE
ncbi:MAG: hypothetical protein ACOZAA_13060 [Pseudomonadota bacterium]